MPVSILPASRASLLALIVGSLSLASDVQSREAAAQQEPVAVAAVAGIDRLLEDADYLFAAGEAPQHTELIRGVVANFNQLRGLDRERPIGLYLYFPAGGESGPQPLLFFPVSDVEELLKSVRIGTALRLERGEAEDRLSLHTDDGDVPIRLEHGYAFLDPTKSGVRLNQPLADPDELLQDALHNQDAVLVIRREGIPPFLFELALGKVRTEAVREQTRKPTETDAEYELRSDIQQRVFTLMEAFIQDWRGATVSLTLSSEERKARIDARVDFDPDGKASKFLSGIRGEGTRFESQLAEPSAFSLSTNWQSTPAGRDLLGEIVGTIRQQMAAEVADADDESREAVTGVVDALETTFRKGGVDAFFQLVGTPPNGFVLVGAAAIEECAKVASGLERLLPLAAGSDDILAIEMNVARAGDVAIHRMLPKNLRKQDRRLYGDDAAIYIAAGRDAIWMAIGGEGTAGLLAGSIEAAPIEASEVFARPGSRTEAPLASLDGRASLVELRVHAADWVGFARTDSGGHSADVAQLARSAFEDPDEDAITLSLQVTDEGLRLHARLDHGYVRLLGLALTAGLAKQ